MDSPLNPQIKFEKNDEELQRLDDKHQNQDENKGQASRRSRKDVEGRDFVCGCGKKYLSYPALYTHIKTKHDGKQPEGTVKYSTAAAPKKNKTKLQQEHLNEMISLVKRQDLRLLDILGQKFEGSTSVSSRLKSKILEKPITDSYHNLLKNSTSPLKLNKQSPLQQHLITYLIGAGQHLKEKLHQQYQWFARTVKQCYYQMGNQVYNKCFSKKQGGLCYIPNFKVEKVKYFPLICDFYIRFFLPYEYSELNNNLMELILTDFCQWLNKRKCTFIQIILNKEYKLIKPLQFEEDLKNQKDIKNNEDDQDRADPSEIQEAQSSVQNNNKQKSNQGEINESQQNQNQLQVNLQEVNESDGQNKVQQNKEQLAKQEPKPLQNGVKQNNQIIQNNQNNQKVQNNQNNYNAQIKENNENNVNEQQQNDITEQKYEAGNLQNHHKNMSLQVEPGAESSQQISEQLISNGQKKQDPKGNQSEAPRYQKQEFPEQNQQPESDNA